MKKLLLAALSSALLLTVPSAVLASSRDFGISQQDEVQVQIQHQNHGHDSNRDKILDDQGKNSGSQSVEDRATFEIENNNFKISGQITQVAQDSKSLIINSQTINIDPTKTGKYDQKGKIIVGAFARVEAEKIGGSLYATEVKIEAQGKFGHPPARVRINLTAAGSATHSATPSASIRVSGTIDQVVKFLEQILGFLKGLV